MIAEKIISLIAPHNCMECGVKGYVICEACSQSVLERLPSRCYRCHASTAQFSVCKKCCGVVKLKRVWVVTSYDGIPKDVIDLMKFERASAASKDIAREMSEALPLLDDDSIICHVPTAPEQD